MKKLLLLFIPLVFFFGCEEENNNESTECLLYGTWDYAYEQWSSGYCAIWCDTPVNETPCSMENVEIYPECEQITFNNDGTYTLTIEDNNSYSYQGAWSGGCAVGESLSFIPEFDYDPENITTFEITSISANSLTIVVDGSISSFKK